jgi:ATP synthase in type III secretion protein N
MYRPKLVPRDAMLLRSIPLTKKVGLVHEAIGNLIKAIGVNAKIGEFCEIRSRTGVHLGYAEVVGFSGGYTLLIPYEDMNGLELEAEVVATGRSLTIPVGDALKGRVLNGLGLPIDGGDEIKADAHVPVVGHSIAPLNRGRIDETFETGVKVLDGLNTVGVGQRVGIFAPAGTGKSVLLGMLAKHSTSDVNVVALIGERGREVREFIEDNLGVEGLAKSVLVVATADCGPLERTKAALVATTIAEYFRDQGAKVLLLCDSITRFARAQREIGLARGEPPTRRGFPPSLFTALPQLFERAGPSATGAITAFYTVLMEDDATPDPVAEEVRSLLDGHIILSPKNAAKGIYPAVDVNKSLSRVMSHIVSSEHQTASNRVRELFSKHEEIELLLQVGEYKPGHDNTADDAIARMPDLLNLVKQQTHDCVPLNITIDQLAEATGYSIG